jgi:hypothetical protein
VVRFKSGGGIIKTNFGCQTTGHLKKLMMGVLYVIAAFKLRLVFLEVFIGNKCSCTEKHCGEIFAAMPLF